MRLAKNLTITIVFVLLTGIALAQNWGVIRYAHTSLNIRANRSTNSVIVGKLTTGQKIRADYLSDNWYAVFDLNEKKRNENRALGYVFAPLLKPNPLQKPVAKSTTANVLKYKIVKKEDVSYQGKSRMVNRVMLDVQKLPSEEMIKKTAQNIWKDGNSSWKEFTIFFYLHGMPTNNVAYAIAEYRPNGLLEYKVNEWALYGTKWKK